MKVGLVLPMSAAERTLAFARRAERLGFDGVFAFDHLFPPGAPVDRPSLESYTTLAAVASVTDRVTIGTLVTRASLRPAGTLAKAATALDDISGGRFVLGIGTGDALSRSEHEAFGIPYLGAAVRRQHLVETVLAVRALFRGEPWAGGEHVPPIAGPLLPRPQTPGGPPVWIGGTSEQTALAACGVADGWNGWGLDLELFERRAALVLRSAAAEGRAVEPTWAGPMVVGEDLDDAGRLLQGRAERGIGLDVWAGDVDGATAWIARLGAAGATWAILLPAGAPDRMELIGERVLPSVRSRT
ncbi:MAG TPA: LLM class flavin-dependent oxidoreductase [Actinomycetota bacterium]